MSEFGFLVQRYRRIAGLTQEELAERAGYSLSHVRKLEQGARRPTDGAAEGLASALNLAPEDRAALQAARAGDDRFPKLPGWLADLVRRFRDMAEAKLAVPRGWLIAILSLLSALLGVLILLSVLALILLIRDLRASPTATTRIVSTQQIIPGGEWISPKDGQHFSRSVHFAAHAYPTNPGDPPIKYVIFTAWWPAAGGGPWPKVCWVRTHVDMDVYQCTWRFRWHSRSVPRGAIKISFDVYDRMGNRNLAPNGVHTIYFSPRRGS